MPHAEREGERLAPQTGHEAPSNVSQSSHSQVAFRPVWKSLDPFACAFFCLKTFQQRVFKLRFAIVNNNPTGFCYFFETTPHSALILRNGYFPPRERKIDRSFSVIIIWILVMDIFFKRKLLKLLIIGKHFSIFISNLFSSFSSLQRLTLQLFDGLIIYYYYPPHFHILRNGWTSQMAGKRLTDGIFREIRLSIFFKLAFRKGRRKVFWREQPLFLLFFFFSLCVWWKNALGGGDHAL